MSPQILKMSRTLPPHSCPGQDVVSQLLSHRDLWIHMMVCSVWGLLSTADVLPAVNVWEVMDRWSHLQWIRLWCLVRSLALGLPQSGLAETKQGKGPELFLRQWVWFLASDKSSVNEVFSHQICIFVFWSCNNPRFWRLGLEGEICGAHTMTQYPLRRSRRLDTSSFM